MKTGCIYLFFLIPFSICRHIYFVPQAQNVPLFKEKNEMRFCAAYGTTEEISTVDVQAAYSISNNFAVMAKGMYGYAANKPLAYNYGEGY